MEMFDWLGCFLINIINNYVSGEHCVVIRSFPVQRVKFKIWKGQTPFLPAFFRTAYD